MIDAILSALLLLGPGGDFVQTNLTSSAGPPGLTCRTPDYFEQYTGDNPANLNNWDVGPGDCFNVAETSLQESSSNNYNVDCTQNRITAPPGNCSVTTATSCESDGDCPVSETCEFSTFIWNGPEQEYTFAGNDDDIFYRRNAFWYGECSVAGTDCDVDGDCPATETCNFTHNGGRAGTPCADPANCRRQFALPVRFDTLAGLSDGHWRRYFVIGGDDVGGGDCCTGTGSSCTSVTSDVVFTVEIYDDPVVGTADRGLRFCGNNNCTNPETYVLPDLDGDCVFIQLDLQMNDPGDETVDVEVWNIGEGECGQPSGAPDYTANVTWTQSAGRNGFCWTWIGSTLGGSPGGNSSGHAFVYTGGGLAVDNGTSQICQ